MRPNNKLSNLYSFSRNTPTQHAFFFSSFLPFFLPFFLAFFLHSFLPAFFTSFLPSSLVAFPLNRLWIAQSQEAEH
jgi:hypothetical protein